MATGQELATAYLSLTVSARGINKDIQRELSGLDKDAEKSGKSSGGAFSSAFKGALTGIAAAISVGAIKDFVSSTVDGAGQMQQSLGALDAVFKGSSGQMKAWSKSAATDVGLTGNEFNELGVLIGAQLKNGGTAMEDLAPKTNDLIALGADLSSMFGGSTKDAVDSLSSALKGERDPIEKYGVSLSQAKVDAEAAALGFEKVGGALSAEGTQAATLSLIMKQTADSHGNFAAESDTFAHKQQVMSAKWEDLKVKIGEKFMPAMTKAFGFISDTALPALEGFGAGLAATGQWIKDNAAWLVPLVAGVAGYALAMGTLSIISTVRGWVAAATLAQWGLNAALNANPIGLIIAGITALVAGLVWFFTQTEIGQKIVTAAWAGIKAAIGGVVNWFQTGLLPIIQTVFSTIGTVFTWLYETIIKPVFALIQWAIEAWWTVASGIFQGVVALIRNVLGPIFSWLWNSIIKPVFGFIGSLISSWWNGIVKPIFDGLVGFFKNVLGPIFTWLWNNIVSPAFNGIRDVITKVWDVIKPVFDKLAEVVRGLPAAFEAAKDGIGKAWDKVKEIAKTPVRFVIEKVINDGLIGTFNKIPGVDIKKVPLPPGFRKGGYTGDIGKDDVAGYVHGKEYVFTAEQTAAIGKERLAHIARNAGSAAVAGGGNMGGFFTGNTGNIRKHGAYHLSVPSSMSAWNFPGAARMWDGAAGIKVAIGRGNAQGYASPRERGGGILGFASGNNIDMSPQWMNTLNAVQRQTVAAHEMGHAMGLPHNSGSSIMQPNLARMANSPTLQDIVNLQSLYPGGSGKAGSAVPDNPFNGLIDTLMNKLKAEFPAGGMMVDAVGGLAKSGINQVTQIVQDIKDGLKDLAGDVFGKVKGFFGGGAAMAPTVYDGGGWLEKTGRPQLVQHNRSKPDAVLSNEQWGTMTRIAENSAGTGGGVTINGDVYGATPEQIVSEWDTKQRRAASMHNLRKVMVA